MSPLLAPSPFVRPQFLGRARLAQGTQDQMQQMFPGASGMGPAQTPQGTLAQNGAILSVQISSPSGGTPVTIQAMIDTGASISTINSQVAQNAGLQQTGSTQLGGVGGVQDSAIYAAAINLPDYGVQVNPVQVASVPGQLPAPADMLIGRDILENLVLNWDGSQGVFTLTQAAAAPQAPTTNNQVAASPATPGTIPQPAQPTQGPLPQPPASSPIPWPWIGGGVAAVGLVVGGLFLFKVL